MVLGRTSSFRIHYKALGTFFVSPKSCKLVLIFLFFVETLLHDSIKGSIISSAPECVVSLTPANLVDILLLELGVSHFFVKFFFLNVLDMLDDLVLRLKHVMLFLKIVNRALFILISVQKHLIRLGPVLS